MDKAENILGAAESAGRSLTESEQLGVDTAMADVEACNRQIPSF